MTVPAWQSELVDSSEAAPSEQPRGDGFKRSRRSASDGTQETAYLPRPLEFDSNGFPVAQRRPSFVARVDRLRSL
jgi:hypothetical protein